MPSVVAEDRRLQRARTLAESIVDLSDDWDTSPLDLRDEPGDWAATACSANLRPFLAVRRRLGPPVHSGHAHLRPFLAFPRRFGQHDPQRVVWGKSVTVMLDQG